MLSGPELFNAALSFLATPGRARPLVLPRRTVHLPFAPRGYIAASCRVLDDSERCLYRKAVDEHYARVYWRRQWGRALVFKEDGTIRTIVYMTTPPHRHRQSPVRSKSFHQLYLASRSTRLPHLLPGYPFLALGVIL